MSLVVGKQTKRILVVDDVVDVSIQVSKREKRLQ